MFAWLVRLIRRLVWLLLALFAAAIGYVVLRGKPAVGTGSTVNLKAHVPGTNDLYCVYPIKTASPGAPLHAKDKICIYCVDPGPTSKCDAIAKVKMAGGVWYDLEGADNPICDECPNRNFYEITP